MPVVESPLCAVIDPVRDYRWHALRCGGPETAAFLCEMESKLIGMKFDCSCYIIIKLIIHSSKMGCWLHTETRHDCTVYV